MPMSARSVTAAVTAVVAFTLAGCADDPAETDAETPAESGQEAFELDVEIENGQTSPAGRRIEVEPGQQIRVEVDSDIVDELHLHADPEQTFDVKARDDQTFEFMIEQPGVYELESHETGNQIVSIQVQPH